MLYNLKDRLVLILDEVVNEPEMTLIICVDNDERL